MIHQLSIPDALLDWGKRSEVAIHFHRPWAHDVERIIEEGVDEPLDEAATERLFARLEALCNEAIRHERGDLLLGLDVFTAELLGLVFSWGSDGEALGCGKRWSYQEARALLGCQTGSGVVAFCEKAKDLVGGVFPRARIGAIIDAREAPPDACAGCGEAEATVMLTLESGNRYCGTCWTGLTGELEVVKELKAREMRRRGR